MIKVPANTRKRKLTLGGGREYLRVASLLDAFPDDDVARRLQEKSTCRAWTRRMWTQR